MRPGLVVNIRVNPKDCLAVLDVMDAAGISTVGMSFPQMVSLALSSLLETAKLAGQIEERTGFEYAQMMQPYIGQRRDKRKLAIAETIHMAGSSIKAPPIARGFSEAAADTYMHPAATEEDVTEDMRAARQSLTTLAQKKDMADDGVAGITWSQSDEREYNRLVRIVYPNG